MPLRKVAGFGDFRESYGVATNVPPEARRSFKTVCCNRQSGSKMDSQPDSPQTSGVGHICQRVWFLNDGENTNGLSDKPTSVNLELRTCPPISRWDTMSARKRARLPSLLRVVCS